MPYPTDNPIDGQGRAEGGEVAAGRAAMPLHTPGPWEARLSRYEDGVLIVQGTHIAHNRVLARFGLVDEIDDQCRADAALIAAAPTMVAALRLALPELREDLESLVECNSTPARDWSANMPLPDTLDMEALAIAVTKKAAYDAVVAAIAAAERR